MVAISSQKPNYVLDSYALLAYFQAESGGQKVNNLLERARRLEINLYLSIINMGEVFYITSRAMGNSKAESMLLDIQKLPVSIKSITNENVISAARLKAQYPISFCDAFAGSLAQDLQAFVVTGDHEFENIQSFINIEWLV